MGRRHALGDGAPDTTQPLAAPAGARLRGLGLRPGLGEVLDIAVQDASARAAALDACDVDAEVARQLSHRRHRLDACLCRPPGSGPMAVAPLGGNGLRCGRRRRSFGSLGLCTGHRRRRRRSLACFLADRYEDCADGDDLALGHVDSLHDTREGGRDLGRRLVGDDLDEEVILGHDVAFADEPAIDLTLGHSLPEVGQLELGH
jgi:hypothetical protein